MTISCKIGDVGRIVCGHSEGADFVGNTEPSKIFHRASLGGVSLRIIRSTIFSVIKSCAYVSTTKLYRKHQPKRSASNYYDFTVQNTGSFGHLFSEIVT